MRKKTYWVIVLITLLILAALIFIFWQGNDSKPIDSPGSNSSTSTSEDEGDNTYPEGPDSLIPPSFKEISYTGPDTMVGRAGYFDLEFFKEDSESVIKQKQLVRVFSEAGPIVSDAGYFAVTYDANSNSGTFAFALETQGDRRFHESTVEECKNIEQATFEGAAALLEEIKNSGYTSIIIHMDKESCALLRRNAIYGIVDEYTWIKRLLMKRNNSKSKVKVILRPAAMEVSLNRFRML